jgi:hypothetical protein
MGSEVQFEHSLFPADGQGEPKPAFGIKAARLAAADAE